MKHTRTCAAVLVAGLVFVAVLTPRAHGQNPTMSGYPALGSAATVTVLAPGAAPRVPLRYKLARGDSGMMDMTMSLGVVMSVGGIDMPMDLPAMTYSVSIDVSEVAANGDITFNLAFVKVTIGPGADPTVAAAMEAAGSAVTSIKGTATVSNRGVTKSAKLDLSKVDPAMAQALGQMSSSVENLSMPFPEEAVGAGARWEVRQALTAGGITMFQKSEYELVSMDGPTIVLKVKLDQTAPPQALSNPNMPAGVDMSLEKMTSSGSGTMTARLDSLIPTSSMESLSSMVMGMSAGGQVESMSTDTKLKLTIAPAVKK